MLKLVKYEFRKARNALLVLVGITAFLQITFSVGLATEKEDLFVISAGLLALCAFAVSIFVLVRGITTYTSELKSKAGYMTFLTPNSALKIMASKFLYTFLNALLAFTVFVVLFWLDFSQMMRYFNSYEALIQEFAEMIEMYGFYVRDILVYGLFMLAFGFLQLLSMVAVAYFACTVSATLFRDKSWSWLPSLVLFFAINYGLSRLNGWIAAPVQSLELVSVNFTGHAVAHTADAWQTVAAPTLLPLVLVSVATILISMFSCAYMLERKVSL